VKHVEELKEVIRKVHGAEAVHIESVPVKEVFQGKTVWDGVVEVFALGGHDKATKAYAWSHDTDTPGVKRHYAVLHLGPVTSAVMAVRASIVGEFRQHAEES
jgi:hypothetical protein